MKLLTEANRKALPKLYSQEDVDDPMCVVKFFDPTGSWTWYAIEFDGDDLFFGYVDGLEAELGNFSLSELESVKGRLGIGIERDMHYTPERWSVVKARVEGRR